MDFFTHLVVGIAFGRYLFQNPNYQKAFILGSISPDLDVFLAWLPVLIPELVILSHRGIFHTLLFMPFVIPILIYGTQYLPNIKRFKHFENILQDSEIRITRATWFIGISGSYLHLIMDTINPQGTILLYPVSIERISFSTISFFDPVVTILAGGFFFWFLYKKVYKQQNISMQIIDRYTRTVALLFIITVSGYGLLQTNTVNNYRPETSTVGFFSFQRWIIQDQDDSYSVSLVNQLTQQVERSYKYQKLIWNYTQWSESEIKNVIINVEQTQEYQKFIFTLNPDTRLVYNITTNLTDDNWIIEITDIFDDVQSRYWDFVSNPFTRSSFEIKIPIL